MNHSRHSVFDSLDTVAHDLKTPLTRLRNSAESALQSPGDSETAREALSDCMEESDRVLSMLAVLMDMAEARTGSMRLEREETSVSELIEGVVALYELVAEERHVTIRTELMDGLTIVADRRRLQQMFANLRD